MPSPSIVLIANPAAGGGRGARWLPAARAAFAPLGATIHSTAAPGDETRLARAAADAGATTIVVLGGDGTWSRAAQAVVGTGATCALAFLSAGSGNDFVKSLGTPASDYAAMARLVASGRTRTIDAGMVDGVAFINAVGFAFDAAVVDRMRRAPGGGRLAYLTASLAILFGYPGIEARVEGLAADGADGADGAPGAPGDDYARHLAIVLANGRHFGGSFVIAPDAALDDARLDRVTIAAPLSTVRRAAVFGACGRGAHGSHDGVSLAQVASTRIAFRTPPLLQADGELHQATGRELEVRCLPAALRVVA